MKRMINLKYLNIIDLYKIIYEQQRIFTFNFETSNTNSQQTSTVYSTKTFIIFISAQKTFIEFTLRIVPSFFHVDEYHCVIVVDYHRHTLTKRVSLRQRKTRNKISKIVEFYFEFRQLCYLEAFTIRWRFTGIN